MAKAIVCALFFLAFASIDVHSQEPSIAPSPATTTPLGSFDVEGAVYCDPCRVDFPTPLSYPIADAIVQLECRRIANEEVTYDIEAITDAEGKYKITVTGSHENDVCEVKGVNSPDHNCNNILDTQLDRARVVISDNTGIHSEVRYANPVAFVPNEKHSQCQQILAQLGANEDGSPFDALKAQAQQA